MFGRVLLPALFMGFLISILMQLTSMWPLVSLSRELDLSAHRVLYASAAALLLCNTLALPLMTWRTAQRRPRLTVCLAGCLATAALAAGSAVLLLVSCSSREFLLEHLSGHTCQDLQVIVGRYLGLLVNCCAGWPACRDELASHTRILLLSAAYYNSLACLLSVATACLIVRGVLLASWLTTPEEEDEEAAAAEAEAAEATTTAASPDPSPPIGDGGAAAPNANLPISPVWLVLQ